MEAILAVKVEVVIKHLSGTCFTNMDHVGPSVGPIKFFLTQIFAGRFTGSEHISSTSDQNSGILEAQSLDQSCQ